MKKTLILGYGNPDRQDDGVAWAIVGELAQKLGLPRPSTDDPKVDDPTGNLTFIVALQLLPEMAEEVAGYERVCFVDAHTGRVPEELSIENLGAEFQSSPFTHHLTPQTCLSLVKSLYAREPEGRLISVRGYEFGFSNSLSDRTRQLADRAVRTILTWLEEGTVR